MNDTKIESMKVFYDNHNRQFLKALVVTSDGKDKIVKKSEEIKKLIEQLKEQEGVEVVSELPASVFQCAFQYKPNGELNQGAIDWANSALVSSNKVKLNRTSPYNGKQTNNIQKAKSSTVKKVVVAGLVMAVVALGVGCCKKYLDSQAQAAAVTVEALQEETELKKMAAPENWLRYLVDYEESKQKEFLTNTMSVNLVPNVKEITLSTGENFQYGFTAEEAVCLSLYADIYHYSEEGNNDNIWDDFYAVVGDYSISEIKSNAQNAILKMQSSFVLADKKEDMLIYQFKDEQTNKLLNEYLDLILEYKNATKKADKKEIQEKIQDKLIRNFINRQEGGDEYVGFEENAEAYFVILNTIPLTCSNLKIDLPNDIVFKLNGTEANFDDDGKLITAEVNGYADRFCAQADSIFKEFDEYRQNKRLDDSAVDRQNESLSQIDGYKQAVSSRDEILWNTYDLEHMTDIMNKYLEQEYGLTLEELDVTTLINAASNKMEEEFKSQPISKENPYGGQKGDSYKENIGKVTVSNEVVQESFTKEEIQQAQTEAKEEAAKDGVISQEQFEEEKKELNDKEVVDDYGNKGTISTDYTAITWSVYHHFTGESNGHTIIPYDANWANSSDELTRAAYNLGKQRADEYLAAKNQASQDNITNSDNAEDIYGDSYAGDHSQNPNQNKTANTENNNEMVETSKQEETSNSNNNITTDSTVTNDGADKTPSTNENPNQSGSTSSEDSSASKEEVKEENTANNNITSSSTTTTEGADKTPHTSQNPNQNGTVSTENNTAEEVTTTQTENAANENITTTSQDTIYGASDIVGEVTTDSTGVEDMSQYGDYSGYSLEETSQEEEVQVQAETDLTEVYAAIAELAVEEMANQPSEETEQAIQLTK